jgi:Tol biopolymer transport system component
VRLAAAAVLARRAVVVAICALTACSAATGQTRLQHNGLIAFNVDYGARGDAIFTMTSAGKQLHRLTHGTTVNDRPVWSPNGKTIAFARRTLDTTDELYVMNADGSHVREVTFADRGYDWPSWSPDGRELVFGSDALDEQSLFVARADGTQRSTLLTVQGGPWLAWPAWSPDGRRIAYVEYDNGLTSIWVANSDGTAQHELSPAGSSTSDDEPTWSPDGSRIAFISDRSGDSDVWFMNADGSGARDLTNHPANEFAPAWSPDGRLIAFSSDRARKYHQDIYVMHADGTHVVRITRSLGQGAYQPSWQPKLP